MSRQIPDWILFRGGRRPLSSGPSPFPPVFKLLPGQMFSGGYNGARGYVATWEIKDDRLFVITFGGTLDTVAEGERDIGMKEVYGTEKPVWAEWVSKTFAIPVGKEIPDPEGFRSPTWSAYCDVEVVNGRVVGMTERTAS